MRCGTSSFFAFSVFFFQIRSLSCKGAEDRTGLLVVRLAGVFEFLEAMGIWVDGRLMKRNETKRNATKG